MRKKFCVIGLGKFGIHVTKTLYQLGHEVTAIDADKEQVQAAKDYCTMALLGDASNKDFLEAQGIRDMEAVVVSTGERSHLSTLITLFLKELKVKRILVKAINEDHGRILARIGATDIIYPEKDMGKRVAHALSNSNTLEFVPLGEDYAISEIAPPVHFIGKSLIELDLRRRANITIIAVKDVLTDQFLPSPPPDYRIKDSDALILIGRTRDVDNINVTTR